jgi:hypothetical protein
MSIEFTCNTTNSTTNVGGLKDVKNILKMWKIMQLITIERELHVWVACAVKKNRNSLPTFKPREPGHESLNIVIVKTGPT